MLQDELYKSSESRPLPLRMRSDLIAAQLTYRCQPCWIVKDPLSMEFYRLNEEEFAILELLDGRRSATDVKLAFEQRFSPQRITEREVLFFATDLQKKSLLLAESPDQGQYLLEQAKERKWKKTKEKFANFLAIRWRGVDPDRLLTWLTPWVGWFFSKWTVAVMGLALLTALLWVGVQFDEFQRRLPALDDFFAHGNGFLLIAVIAVTKIIHELSHGICFKRYGGECHEIGVMLLVFTPTLYCNTSDAWLMPKKWHRMAIGLAGIYIELVLATVATFLWWFSQPGVINFICLDIMFSCSLSAIVLNGNPLLRYDGYYVASDLFEFPNLYQRSGKVIHDWFMTYLLGIPRNDEPDTPLSAKLMMASYRLASTCYLLTILSAILLILVELLRPYGLANLGIATSMFSFVGLFGAWGLALYRGFRVPGSIYKVKMTHVLPTCAVFFLLLIAICLVPLPHFVQCSFYVEPDNAKSVYVEHDAIMKEIYVTPGDTVKAGQSLGLLRDLDTDLKINELRIARETLQTEREVLEFSRHTRTDASARLADLSAVLETVESQLTEVTKIQQSLTLPAPCDGVVIPEWVAAEPTADELQLKRWHGSPLARENIGTSYARGETICRVGDPSQLVALLVIDQTEVEFVRERQTATLLLDSRPNSKLSGPITSVSRGNATQLPANLARPNGGRVEAEEDRAKTTNSEQPVKPASISYQAKVELDHVDFPLTVGLRGSARIHVGYRSIGARLQRAFYDTFRLKLS